MFLYGGDEFIKAKKAYFIKEDKKIKICFNNIIFDEKK